MNVDAHQNERVRIEAEASGVLVLAVGLLQPLSSLIS